MSGKITVIMATYNGEKYLREQLDSLCNQSYLPDALLISDNESTDSTQEIIDEFSKHSPFELIVKRHEGSEGTPAFRAMDNFMSAVRAAEGDYFLFCDQDDYWIETKVEKTFAKIRDIEKTQGKENPVLVACDSIISNASLQVIEASSFRKAHIDSKSCDIARVLAGGVFQGCMMGFNRALLELLKRGDIAIEMSMHDGWAATIASSCGSFELLDEPLLFYRIHGNNTCAATGVQHGSWNPITRIRNAYSSERQAMITRTKRAALLLSLFGDEMHEEAIPIVRDFSNLYEHNKLVRLAIILKYRILRQQKHYLIRELLAV